MTGGFTVQPESLGSAATQMRAIAQQLGPAWQPVAHETESVKFGRGDDVVSPLIQASLMGALQLVNSCITSSSRALDDYAAGLDAMAKTYAGTETSNQSMFKGK